MALSFEVPLNALEGSGLNG
ncbi:MAG: hypothetical protein BAJALOKI1v1_2430003, partial [Promethearchaeota archaeon]